jgi:hypothetical protein
MIGLNLNTVLVKGRFAIIDNDPKGAVSVAIAGYWDRAINALHPPDNLLVEQKSHLGCRPRK